VGSSCSEAWFAFLQIPLPERLLYELLPELTTTVVRHIKNPITLSDFFTKAVDRGGMLGILALQGLFFLVTEHGLEHPEFYERLYNLLVPQVR
jgi:U3 small nucleolar RNA-associated protein 19